MAHAFYLDVHVPSAVATGLLRCGIDVITSQEDGTREFQDEALLERAQEVDRVLFTQDEDLLAIAAQWQQQQREFPGVVFSHQLGPGIGEIIENLELLAFCAEDDELENQVVYLPLT